MEELQLLFRFHVMYLGQQFLWTVRLDKTADVHVDECRHQKLTIESVHYTAMSWDYIAKILIDVQKYDLLLFNLTEKKHLPLF